MSLFRDFRRIVSERGGPNMPDSPKVTQDWIGMWYGDAYVVIHPPIPRLLEVTYYGISEGEEKTETKLAGPLNPLKVTLHEGEPPEWPGDWNIKITFKIPLPGVKEAPIPDILKKRP